MPPPHDAYAAALPRTGQEVDRGRAQVVANEHVASLETKISIRGIEEFAQTIRGLARPRRLDFTLSVGRLVIDRFYGGDSSAWRARGAKDVTLRRLAAGLSAAEALSPSTLYRCLATAELVQRIGDVSMWQHITASHVRVVLPLSPARQDELLARAERERWSVRRLDAEATRKRTAPRRRRGPPRFIGEVGRMSRFVLRDDRFADVDRARELSTDERRDVCATLVGVRRRCDDLLRQLAPHGDRG